MIDTTTSPAGQRRASQAGVGSTLEGQARIEDHALIGDMHTCALVTKDGTIDWMCVPAFDSDACFAALLGTPDNGHWTIAPSGVIRKVARRYWKDTLVLETEFTTESGTIRLIDFMPPFEGHSNVVRTVECLRGEVAIHAELKPRFGFGRAVPRVKEFGEATKCWAGPDALYLRGGPGRAAPPLVADFTLAEGTRVSYVLTYGDAFAGVPDGVDPVRAERETERSWSQWAGKIRLPTEYREEVVRSLLTLRACIYEPTGGIVAAPTTSLPETPGGVRNWDYRFCWLRDASLTVGALIAAGLEDEAKNFFNFMVSAIAGEPDQVQIMYGIRGERRLTEAELHWLPGYGGAKPVRIGNAAYEQFQLDVLGEVAETIYLASRHFGALGPEAHRAMFTIAKHVSATWMRPDRGIWEMRGPERSFTASKVSAWGALDRAIRLADEGASRYPVEDFRAVRQTIFDEVCREGFNEKLNSFTQYYGGEGLDASLLFIPLTGFLPPTDPRVIGTVAALERGLLEDGLLLRFKPEGAVDGLSGKEGVFLAASFWLVDTYALMGREDDAHRLYERVLSTVNDLGLLSEEYSPSQKIQLGNFPQAFSHFALVRAAYVLTKSGAPSLH